MADPSTTTATPTDWGTNVPLYDPSGNLRAVPQEQAATWLAQPGVARAIPMAKDGVHRWIHEADVPSMTQQGAQISFPEPGKTGWGHYLSDLAGIVRGGVGQGAAGASTLMGLPNEWQRAVGLTPITDTVKQTAANAPKEWAERKAAGYSLPYRVAAPAVELAGTNVPGMEQSAKEGDTQGVLAHAAAGMTAATAPLVGEGALRGANKIIPSTTRAGLGLGALETRYAAHPIDAPLAGDAVADITKRMNTTGEQPHPLIQAFDQRMQMADMANSNPAVAQQLEAQGIPTKNPLTFDEARTFLKRANELKYDYNLGPSTTNQLSQFAGALDKDITAGVAQPSAVAPQGFLSDYSRMRNEYRRASAAQRVADNAGPVIGGATGAYLGRNMGGMADAALMSGGAYAGKVVGKPVIGGLARSVLDRNAGPPNISKPPLPPTPIPPAEYTRILLRAKDGDLSPGAADTQITKLGGKTRVNPLPQPPE